MKTLLKLIVALLSVCALSACSAFKEKITGMEFVKVKGGCFMMGDVLGDGDPDEKPVHEVCLSDYYLGKYEVTQGEWKMITGNNPSDLQKCGDRCPVEKISWNDTQEFITAFNKLTGLKARLPTEAEWEFAARDRGGKSRYSGGDNINQLGWYDRNAKDTSHPVGQLQPNDLGIYDMSGNVWEWVNDWYDREYYKTSPKENPKGPAHGHYKVMRGGSWFYNPKEMRLYGRYDFDPRSKGSYLGLRLAFPVE